MHRSEPISGVGGVSVGCCQASGTSENQLSHQHSTTLSVDVRTVVRCPLPPVVISTIIMVELQMQPLDLSCPAKKLPSSPGLGGLLGPLCLKKVADDSFEDSLAVSSSGYSESRRFSGGSDDITVTSTDLRSPSGSPIGEAESDHDNVQDLSRDETGPARKRFLSKFFKDPRGRCPSVLLSSVRSITLNDQRR